jgi:hypothetical protein
MDLVSITVTARQVVPRLFVKGASGLEALVGSYNRACLHQRR